MLRSMATLAAAAAVIVGAVLTATTANAHGSLVNTLATTTTLAGEARGDSVSKLASAAGKSRSRAARADATADRSVRAQDDAPSSTAITVNGGTSDRDAHGDAVSAVAKSDSTSARETGGKSNHGAAVSAVAKKH